MVTADPRIATTLTIPKREAEGLRLHAERSYPEECCGVLIGRFQEGGALVIQAVPTENQSRRRAHEQYEIAPADLLRVLHLAASVDAEIVGYYHSHPDGPATPSIADESAAWTGVSYVIVGVSASKVVETRSWRFEGGLASEEFVSCVDLGVCSEARS